MQVERSEEAVVEESPKCLCQLGSRPRILRKGSRVKKHGREVARKSQVVPSQSEKRDDGHGTASRIKGKEYDGPLAQVGETMGFKVVCCDMAELESRWVTRVCLDRTGEKGEDVVGATAGIGSLRRMINGSEMDLPCSRVCPGIQEDQQWSR